MCRPMCPGRLLDVKACRDLRAVMRRVEMFFPTFQANGKEAPGAGLVPGLSGPGSGGTWRPGLGRSVSIEIQAHEELERGAGPLPPNREKCAGEMVEQLPKTPPPEAPRERAGSASPKVALRPLSGGGGHFGRPFVDPVIPIRDVALDMRTVCVAGRVFAAEHKELTKNNAIVVNFDITDYTSSIPSTGISGVRTCPKPRPLWRPPP